MLPVTLIQQAYNKIEAYTHRTPLSFDSKLNIYIKWENRQITGSFKSRGALNKVLNLTNAEKKKSVLAASAGNHGQGVAFACKLLNIPVTINVPSTAPKTKIKAINNFGARLNIIPGGYEEAEKASIKQAKQTKEIWISPYNDLQVIAGQGTIAIETIKQLDLFSIDIKNMNWLVPISGGGLISGIAAYIKHEFPDHRIIGVQPETNAFMFDILKTGTQNNTIGQGTIADGLEGRVENESITIPLVKEYVDDIILVSENQIKKAIAYAWVKYAQKIEGAGAVPLAAVLSHNFINKPVLLVISGGNIDQNIHKSILRDYEHNPTKIK
ncbi:MAG TPA: threonine/serine dehydratase [Anaerolineae bacterium]|nr:threonine/serine dehydratase [Anaerolineae bacterium]